MTVLRSIMFAAAAIAMCLVAQAADWRTHSYDTEGFSVEFSGPVKVEPIAVKAETKKSLVSATSYLQDGGDAYVYLVGASQFAEGATFDFAAGVKGTMDSYKCARVDSDTTPADGQVREIYASKCVDGKVSAGAKFFMRGRRFYQVVYLISNDVHGADAKHFLNSFKLIPPKA